MDRIYGSFYSKLFASTRTCCFHLNVNTNSCFHLLFKCFWCEIMFTWKNLLSLQINISLIVILLWFIQIHSNLVYPEFPPLAVVYTWSQKQKCRIRENRTGTSKLVHRKKTTRHDTLKPISSTFYAHFFRTKVFFLLTFWLCNFFHTKNARLKRCWQH
jgi:hypothetical protein